MNPDRLESLGVVAVALGVVAAVAGAWALAGWPWALVTFAVLAVAAGVTLIRTAALTPPPEPPKAGEPA